MTTNRIQSPSVATRTACAVATQQALAPLQGEVNSLEWWTNAAMAQFKAMESTREILTWCRKVNQDKPHLACLNRLVQLGKYPRIFKNGSFVHEKGARSLMDSGKYNGTHFEPFILLVHAVTTMEAKDRAKAKAAIVAAETKEAEKTATVLDVVSGSETVIPLATGESNVSLLEELQTALAALQATYSIKAEDMVAIQAIIARM